MDIQIQFKNRPLRFQNPHAMIETSDPSSIAETFAKMEDSLRQGYFLAGFFSYEAGYSFEETLRDEKRRDFPLICFGVYDSPSTSKPDMRSRKGLNRIEDLTYNISKEKYSSNIGIIRGFIERGDVYQITYCIKLKFTFRGDASSLYRELFQKQPVPYAAYIETDRFKILSLSPEKFIRKDGSVTVTKPMKGTWPRGQSLLRDLVGRAKFQFDPKNRAENIMIADLLRNDLGRIGTSVRAPRLFEVTKYNTLYQMTSTVTADVAKDVPLYDLFAALFPSGSVTGAPKIRAMEIIRSIETEPRKIYTGAIGYITPDKDLFFNVPIRTILLEGTRGEMGIGGGIVWDSTADGEWDEGVLKARFLTEMGC